MTYSDPTPAAALRGPKRLVAGYAAVAIATLAAIIALRNDPDLVTDAVWVRGSIVVLSSLVMFAFAAGAARGKRRAFLRLRLTSTAMTIAIAVLVALPGLFPLWMRLDQAVCGVILLAVAVTVNRKRLRDLFSRV